MMECLSFDRFVAWEFKGKLEEKVLGVIFLVNHIPVGSIPYLQIAHRLEVWGYTNQVRLRGLIQPAKAGFVCIAAISFSPGIFAKLGRTLPVSQDG